MVHEIFNIIGGFPMKKLLIVLLTLLLFLSIVACSSSNQSSDTSPLESVHQESSQDPKETKVSVVSLKGPTSMGLVKLIQDEQKKEGSPYDFEMITMADEIVSGLSTGEIDIAAVPANVASVLYNKTQGNIKVAAINTLGVLHIVENGKQLSTLEDLRGKTIYTTGKGQSPEHVLNYILNQNGLIPNEDVTIEYKSEPTEVATLLASEENVIAMLPEPFITASKMKNDSIERVFDMTKEWDAVQKGSGGSLVTGVLVVRSDYLEENKKEFDQFLKQYQASIDFTNNNPEEAAKLIDEYGIIGEPVAKAAIPNCNITYIDGEELQENLEGYLKILFKANPQSIGGALPDQEFYYER